MRTIYIIQLSSQSTWLLLNYSFIYKYYVLLHKPSPSSCGLYNLARRAQRMSELRQKDSVQTKQLPNLGSTPTVRHYQPLLSAIYAVTIRDNTVIIIGLYWLSTWHERLPCFLGDKLCRCVTASEKHSFLLRLLCLSRLALWFRGPAIVWGAVVKELTLVTRSPIVFLQGHCLTLRASGAHCE